LLGHLCQNRRCPTKLRSSQCRTSESIHRFHAKCGRTQTIDSPVTNPDLPATNNEAERALRNAVIARRISNGTRSEEGSAAYAATLSVFETCHRRGIEPWRYITNLLARARKSLPHITIPLLA
jgi:hypothetical protein